MLGNAGEAAPSCRARARLDSGEGSTRDRPGQAAEAHVMLGGMEKCGFEQDFEAAEKAAELRLFRQTTCHRSAR